MDQSAIYSETVCQRVVVRNGEWATRRWGETAYARVGVSACGDARGRLKTGAQDLQGETKPSARRVPPASLREALRAWFSPYLPIRVKRCSDYDTDYRLLIFAPPITFHLSLFTFHFPPPPLPPNAQPTAID